jgi:GT2 family glycosyltransferase
MVTRPEVSVVIPTRNRADLLSRAVRSVLAQNMRSEVIVVDDCSTDDTARVLAEFGDRIRVIRTDRNIERGAARNLGARKARATTLAFLDSDDEWKAGKLAKQLPVAADGSPSVTGVEFVDESGEVLRTRADALSQAWENVLLCNGLPGSASSLVVPADVFFQVGGYPEKWTVQGSEDWLFLIRLRLAGPPLRLVTEPLIRYRVHPSNSTADPERFAVSMWSAVEFMERHGYVGTQKLPRLRGRTAVVIARGFAASRRWEEAAGWMRVAVREGSRLEAIRALTMVPASAGRAVLRRVGI